MQSDRTGRAESPSWPSLSDPGRFCGHGRKEFNKMVLLKRPEGSARSQPGVERSETPGIENNRSRSEGAADQIAPFVRSSPKTPRTKALVRFSWEGRPPCRPTNHFRCLEQGNQEKNGTARRPSLPEMIGAQNRSRKQCSYCLEVRRLLNTR